MVKSNEDEKLLYLPKELDVYCYPDKDAFN